MYLSALLALLAPFALGQITNCTDYCTTSLQVCNGTNAQFQAGGIDAGQAASLCAAVCAVYPMTGTVGASSGNTFQCRAYHLGVAQQFSMMGDMGNVTYHCPHSGFYGAGVCGDIHTLPSGAMGTTPATSAADFQCNFMATYCNYTSSSCFADYLLYAPFLYDAFNMSNNAAFFSQTGNTMQCRTTNGFYGIASPSTGCPNAMPVSNGCSVSCSQFCQLESDACGFTATNSSGNAQYTDSGACMTACNGWESSVVNDTQPIGSGDTSGCRWYHLSVAATSPSNAMVHCPHTQNWPTAYCLDDCTNYCNLIQSACPVGSSVQQFATAGDCTTACMAYKVLSPPYTRPVTKGNNLQCRTYHAGVASMSWAEALVHCVHAGNVSTPDWCGASTGSGSTLKVGVATAFLMLVGAASTLFGW